MKGRATTGALVFVVLMFGCRDGAIDHPPVVGPASPALSQDDSDYDGLNFTQETIDEAIVAFADSEYRSSRPDYSDPDNIIGTPPFKFVRRIECEILKVDNATEQLIKRSPVSVSSHFILVLSDARNELYAFTLTATYPQTAVLKLRNYGPLTDENPEVVHQPISKRRFRQFPINFETGKLLTPDSGKCIFVPYPYPADQAYWVFGHNIRNGKLQGLYRNDRYENVEELIGLVKQAVQTAENAYK